MPVISFGIFVILTTLFLGIYLWARRDSLQTLNSLTWNNASTWTKSLPQLCAVVLLLGMAIGPAGAPALAGALRAQPELLQIAAVKPEQPVQVIVQKAGADSAAEDLTVSLGGSVTRDLHIINAFAAEMSAQAARELSASSLVRWISLDAKMEQSSTGQFLSWASSLGTSTPNTFSNSAQAIDSGLGPNDAYMSGSNAKGAFGGFDSEVTPGQMIMKVEVALKMYFATAPVAGEDPLVWITANGSAGKPVTINHTALSGCTGLANACTVYVDVTATRAWQWSDFLSPLEVTIDQSKFASGWMVYYDAVGLRVSDTAGVDNSDIIQVLKSSLSMSISGMFESSSMMAGFSAVAVPSIDPSVLKTSYGKSVHAPEAWNGEVPLRGDGVTVAVVDSGILKNKDIDTRVIKSVNFNPAYHNSADRYGHGTFVASVLAGNGTKSNGGYVGIAPKASLLNVRVSDDNGASAESDVVASLQWILEHKSTFNIRVVNLSLNSSVAQSYLTSPLDAACEILWFNGIVVVASSGNTGVGALYPPANDPFVITAGAVDDKGTPDLGDDTIASFSASGITENGFSKPDLVAPGKNIVALLPENSKLTLGKNHPANRVDDLYFRMSGTSMSAPIVSGAVALLLQSEPYLTPDQVKYRLMASANKGWAGYNSAGAGAGYLDILAAIYAGTTENANTGILVSSLLTTGPDRVNSSVSWNSVSWNSVSWNSVSWNSVSWNSVSWNSVSWNSDYWGN